MKGLNPQTNSKCRKKKPYARKRSHMKKTKKHDLTSGEKDGLTEKSSQRKKKEQI